MKADALLTEHHEVLRSLLRELAATSSADPGGRRHLLDVLVGELGLHTQIEDELFYPAVRRVSPLVAVAHSEHRQIDDQLAVVMRTDPAGDRFGQELQALHDTLEHHASEEERDMFPQSHALGEIELEALGERMAARLERLRRSPLTGLRLRIKRATLRYL